eukprot:jgi/Psemu1/18197/gm1.18197_g
MNARSKASCGKRAATASTIAVAITIAIGSGLLLAGSSSALLHESGIARQRQRPSPIALHLIQEHGPSSETGGSTRVHMAGHHEETPPSVVRTTQQRHGLAHGILCPETVAKMDELTQGGRNNRAVKAFLDRYKRYGPMSCMELLSDPEILPHLTNTLRGLV